MDSACSSDVTIAEGAIEKLNSLLSGYQRPLIVSDVMIFDKYGPVIESILDANVIWSISPVYKKGLVSRYSGIDIILGFGGGKSIDIAKLFANEAGLEWISIPTAASHDGIASDVASVMHDGYRYSEKCKPPKAILADLNIISTAPKVLTLSGIGDIISKTSSLAEWRLAHLHNDEPLDESVFEIVNNSLQAILRDYSLKTLVRSIIDTGNAMTCFGSSRPCSGTEHAISHAMDRRMQSLHGLQVAFATPLSLYFLEKAGFAKHSAHNIHTFLKKTAMPNTLENLDMTESIFLDDIHHALKIMEKRDRYSVLKHCDASDSDLSEAMREIGYL
ncbi:MAG: iron-containing alcohol dehydrogenase [Candidatus Thorarchaeota archaeon]|nr:iron-containing alcohol dehydrogenase [Candidatus Thorarchaeota archaeon]